MCKATARYREVAELKRLVLISTGTPVNPRPFVSLLSPPGKCQECAMDASFQTVSNSSVKIILSFDAKPIQSRCWQRRTTIYDVKELAPQGSVFVIRTKIFPFAVEFYFSHPARPNLALLHVNNPFHLFLRCASQFEIHSDKETINYKNAELLFKTFMRTGGLSL